MRQLRPLLACLLLHCGPDQTTTAAESTTSQPDTTTAGSPGTTTEPTTSSTTPTTTSDAAPCTSSAECPAGDHCILIPCAHTPGPGCDEFHCSPECSSPFDESSAYSCLDDQGCCSDSLCTDAVCSHPSPPESTSGAETTATGTTEDTSGLTPCTASTDCPAAGNCLLKPCDLVDDEPGCDAFHCYQECSNPFDDSAFWTCADDEACCGYDCLAGQCTEMFSSET